MTSGTVDLYSFWAGYYLLKTLEDDIEYDVLEKMILEYNEHQKMTSVRFQQLMVLKGITLTIGNTGN